MEEEWVVSRSKLREVWLEHPEWGRKKMADEVGRSKSWVKQWLKRIRGAPLASQEALRGKSRVPKHPPPPMETKIVEKILEIRDHPPQQLGRTPGPLTILYYLNQEPLLKEAGCKLPRSSRTIWKVLTKHHRIYHPLQGVAEPEGKQQHVVEILNLVDHGSSAVVDSEPAADYNAETALRKLAEFLLKHGRPDHIRLDRDPRWVGSWTAKDFPSPMLRFLLCLGIDPRVCPPQRPDKNPFVERYRRNFKYECQLIEKPIDLNSAREVNQRYVRFYNFERPNQAITCGNQPPRVKFPDAPALPPVPEIIDPDRWLLTLTGRTYWTPKAVFSWGTRPIM
jgi:hypothetical protein